MHQIRKISLDSQEAENLSEREFYSLFIDYNVGQHIPNTELWIDGRLCIKINSLGCAGYEVEPDLPVIGAFGSSSSYITPYELTSWPTEMNIEGYQVLNASLPGYDLPKTLGAYQRLRAQIKFEAVVVLMGNHNMCQSGCFSKISIEETSNTWMPIEQFRANHDEFFGPHPLAFCTMPTSLSPEILERGILEYLLRSESIEPQRFQLNTMPSIKVMSRFLKNMQRYNDFLREYCVETGAILVDLDDILGPKSYDEIGENFGDFVHFRPSLLKRIGSIVGERLGPHLNGLPKVSLQDP